MARDSPGRSLIPRNRTLILATITLVLSTIFLSYLHLSPAGLTLFPKPEGDTMDLSISKHDKHDAEKTYPHLSTLPASLLPSNPSNPSNPQDTPRRLIIIGDVHGHIKNLEALLRKAEFNPDTDAVILAGDMVNKGPDSAGVVALAMRIGAYAVRGNHEDRVLHAWEYHESKTSKKKGKGKKKEKGLDTSSDTDTDDEEEEEDGVSNPTKPNIEGEGAEDSGFAGGSENEEDGISPRGKHKKGKKNGHKKGKGKKGKDKPKKPHKGDLATAKSLKPEHRKWLSELPLILRIGDLGPRYGDVLVVHAGLVPGVPLDKQDSEAVMNMRTLISPASLTEQDLPPPLADQTQQHQGDDITQESQTKQDHKHKGNPIEDIKDMIPSPSRDGTPWARTWTSLQKSLILSRPHKFRPTTIVYGHDAKAGLQLRRYTFGLDSGCGSDKELTGMIFEISRGGIHANGASQSGIEMVKEDEDRRIKQEGRAEDESGLDSNSDITEEENADLEQQQKQQGRARIRHRLVSVPCS